jgi:hypothetical protein
MDFFLFFRPEFGNLLNTLKLLKMKLAALPCLLFLLIGSVANSQLSLLPQIGFEQSRTKVQYNNKDFFKPFAEGNIQVSLRADYRFKKGHGPFVSIASSPATVNINFAEPETLKDNFRVNKSSMQWRLEGGYQYSSKPIYLKKQASKNTTLKTNTEKTGIKKSCGSSAYKAYCGDKNRSSLAKKKPVLNMRLQPSLGVAYRPGDDDIVNKNGNQYEYKAGNWNTALISGLGFEFAKGAKRLFTLSAFYTKGLDDGRTQTINTVTESKSNVTYLRSDASGWGMNVGIPFSLTKEKQIVKSQQQVRTNKTNCIIIKKCSKYN